MKKVLENLNAFQNFGNIPVGQLFWKNLKKRERFQFFWQYTKRKRERFSTFFVCTEHRNPKKGAEWILPTTRASAPRVTLFNEITMRKTTIINKGKKWNEKI